MARSKKPIVINGKTDWQRCGIGWGDSVDVGPLSVTIELTDDIIEAIGKRYMQICLEKQKGDQK